MGHGDIVTYDPTNQMVYVSMKDDGLAVIDTRTQKVVHVFKDIPNPNANYLITIMSMLTRPRVFPRA